MIAFCGFCSGSTLSCTRDNRIMLYDTRILERLFPSLCFEQFVVSHDKNVVFANFHAKQVFTK